jgi:ADP-ribose pyrophosphatase YjhB (NUDIX family)
LYSDFIHLQMKSVLYRFLNIARTVFWWITRPVIVGVRVILARDGQILLVRHTYEDLWFMPGGGVKRGETLEAAARREAREEVGAAIEELRLFGVYTHLKTNQTDHIVVFEAGGFTVNEGTSGEIAEARWFPLDSLPANMSPGQRRRVIEYLRGDHPPEAGIWG